MCVSKSHYRDFCQLNTTEKQNFWYFIKNVIFKALYLNNISYRIFYPPLSCFCTRYVIYESRYNVEDNKILEKCTEQMGKLVNVRFSFHNQVTLVRYVLNIRNVLFFLHLIKTNGAIAPYYPTETSVTTVVHFYI